jgi:hypothetical protein
MDALFAKARHYATIGDCEEAIKGYDEILNLKKITSGKKIDATLDKMRVAFFLMVCPPTLPPRCPLTLLMILGRISRRLRSCWMMLVSWLISVVIGIEEID